MDIRIWFAALLILLKTDTVIGLQGTDIHDNRTDTSVRSRRSESNYIESKTPWQVCINFIGKDSLIPQKCYCGGVLISPKWVISSAHCFRSNDGSRSWRKSQFQFVFGISGGSKRQVFKAKNIIHHDGYRRSKKHCVPGDNDIAIIELDQNVKIDALHVNVLQLPNYNSNFDGKSCLIGDWDGTTGTDLSYETVTITSDDGVCQTNNNTIKSKVLEGGSGGAVACGQESKYLAGIVHYDNRCGRSGTFLPIVKYLNWIGKNTGLFSGSGDSNRGKRMIEESSDCFTRSIFEMIREASNKFMADCFGEYPDPEKITRNDIPSEEIYQINIFVDFFSSDVKTFEAYNVGSLGDLMTLIYHFGRGGLDRMENILSNNIIIRQLNNGELRNGFFLKAKDFYCYPYIVSGEDIQPDQVKDPSYQAIWNKIQGHSIDAENQIRFFAGIDDYPRRDASKHLAHMTFAHLFAESVRNWISLTMGIPLIKKHSESSIKLFENEKWPMAGGSWKNRCTWGIDTNSTPDDIKEKFEKALESLVADKGIDLKVDLNVNKLKMSMMKHFVQFFKH